MFKKINRYILAIFIMCTQFVIAQNERLYYLDNYSNDIGVKTVYVLDSLTIEKPIIFRLRGHKYFFLSTDSTIPDYTEVNDVLKAPNCYFLDNDTWWGLLRGIKTNEDLIDIKGIRPLYSELCQITTNKSLYIYKYKNPPDYYKLLLVCGITYNLINAEIVQWEEYSEEDENNPERWWLLDLCNPIAYYKVLVPIWETDRD